MPKNRSRFKQESYVETGILNSNKSNQLKQESLTQIRVKTGILNSNKNNKI